MGFYRYKLSDFESVPIASLRVGDEIAWSAGSPRVGVYGSVVVDNIQIIPDGYILAMNMPVGANCKNTELRDISVTWNGNVPLIRIYDTYMCDGNRPILKKRIKNAG